MIRFVLLLLPLLITAAEDGVPSWTIIGIARVETRSYWRDGGMVYVDRHDGQDGEAGPFQCTPAMFRLVRRRGESFSRLRTDAEFATDIAIRCLHWFRARCSSWEAAVSAYNTGLGGDTGRGSSYEVAVEQAAGVHGR